MKYSSSVNNYRETPYIVSDTFANKVNYTATIKGAIYFAIDGASLNEPSIFQANGTIWVPVGGYGIGTDATLQDVTTNGKTTNQGITITAGGLSSNTLTVTSLTPKSIPFVGTADLITEDNTNLVWDNVNKWLGIQTNTPTAEVDIHSTTATPMIALNNTAGSPSSILFQNTNVSKWRIGNAASNKFVIFNNNLATTALGIDTTNNSVGINTLSPVANLNLVSTTSIVTFQLHNSVTGSTASDGAKIAVANNEMQIVNREAADIIFYTTDEERLRLLSTGALSSNGFGFIANMGTTNTSGYILNRSSNLYNALIELKNNNSSTWKIGSFPSSDNLSFYSASTTNNVLSLNYTTGEATLTGTLNGTSASFNSSFEAGKSGSLTVGDLFVDNANKTFYIGRQSAVSGDNTITIIRNRVGLPYFYLNPALDLAYFNLCRVLIGSDIDDTVNKLQVTGTAKFTSSISYGTTGQATTARNAQDTATVNLTDLFPTINFDNFICLQLQILSTNGGATVNTSLINCARDGTTNWSYTLVSSNGTANIITLTFGGTKLSPTLSITGTAFTLYSVIYSIIIR
jgi:hypothetical protein